MVDTFEGNTLMKKLFFIAMATMFFAVSAHQVKETFLKALAEYNHGRLQESVELYESLKEKTPAVLYNSGLCYYQLGNYAKALACFRKVEKRGNHQVVKKAQKMEALTKQKLGFSSDSYWYTTVITIKSWVSTFVFQLLFLLFCTFSVFLFYFKKIKRLESVFFVIALTAITMVTFIDYWFSCQVYAVVLQKEVQVYAGPDKEFHKVATLQFAQEVKVVEEKQSWYKISFQNFQGWVEQIYLEKIT